MAAFKIDYPTLISDTDRPELDKFQNANEHWPKIWVPFIVFGLRARGIRPSDWWIGRYRKVTSPDGPKR